MRELLKRAKPDRLEDLIALNALYRPGPMDLIPDFIERKHGRQRVEYLHPSIEPILAETYGVMVYQEQVMRIAQVVGGYSLGSADLLRRAMGKKKPEEMAKHRSIFVDGAGRQGVDAHTATELFNLMEKFAGYGFNKSHSAAYAVVAYQTAYFKAHYPAAFMAANLTAVKDDTDKVKDLIEDCKALGLSGAGAGHQCLRLALRAGRHEDDPLRPRRDQGHGAGRDRGDSGGACERRAHFPISSTCAPGSTSTWSIGAWSRHWCAPGRSIGCTMIVRRCWPRSGARSTRPTARRPAPGRRACSAAARHRAAYRVRQGDPLERAREACQREARARLLLLRPPVSRIRGRGAASLRRRRWSRSAPGA